MVYLRALSSVSCVLSGHPGQGRPLRGAEVGDLGGGYSTWRGGWDWGPWLEQAWSTGGRQGGQHGWSRVSDGGRPGVSWGRGWQSRRDCILRVGGFSRMWCGQLCGQADDRLGKVT